MALLERKDSHKHVHSFQLFLILTLEEISFSPHLAPTTTAFLCKEWLNANLKINFRTDALIPFALRNAWALCNPSQACCGPPPGEEVTLQLLETTVASISLLINMGSANSTHNQWKRCLFFFSSDAFTRDLGVHTCSSVSPWSFSSTQRTSYTTASYDQV